MASAAAVLALLRSGAGAADVANVEWPKVLPEAELSKLVDEGAKVLQDATRSASNFNLKAKNAESEAYALVIYAEAGLKSGNEELARKSAVLQQAALTFAEAAKRKSFDKAKAQVEIIAKFKTMKPEAGGKPAEVSLEKDIPIKGIMDNVNAVNKEMIKYNRLKPPQFNVKGKPEEIALASHKLAALTVAISAHAPEKDMDAKKTRKFWLDTTEEVRAATLEMAAAAKAKKQAEFSAAFRRMDGACAKCHEVYRIEDN